jgi:LacI family transcriptional regulator
MRKKRVSITDIAKELQVTPSTVSRALNGSKKVSEKKRKEILELAKKLGYRPNPSAKNLVNRETNTIGLIIPEFTHHFYSRMLSGIESITSNQGYQLIICTSNEKQKKEIKACETFLDARVDGILATVCKKNEKFGHLQEILDSGTPLVLMDRLCEEVDASYVVSNDFEGAFNAVNYLIESGCELILHISGPKNLSTSFNRMMGYKEALKKHEIEFNPEWIIQNDEEDMTQRIKSCLQKYAIQGVFAYSDYLAYEVYQIAKELNLSVPDDLSIIGFADEPIASYLSPQLTTVNQQPYEMGAAAARFLLNQINQPGTPLETKGLKTKLIVRESTKKNAPDINPPINS